MKLMSCILVGLTLSTGVMADDLEIVGHIDQSVKQSVNSSSLKAKASPMKRIRFLKIELSDKAHQQISDSAKNISSLETGNSSRSRQLGMNNVPVLDQGAHGSCVTFANTAAIDAALNQGDYVSQLCLLQLGRYLEENGYIPSGWDGSFGPIVLNEITTFGVISKAQQMSMGCGGLTQYPMMGEVSQLGTPMSPVDYHSLSDASSSQKISWTSIMDSSDKFETVTSPNQTLNKVKMLLDSGDRLTFGVLLPGVETGVAGAVANYHVNNDTWVLTPKSWQSWQREMILLAMKW